MPQLLNQYGRPFETSHTIAICPPRAKNHGSGGSRYWRTMLARYDAAATTDDNIKHWSQADALSADAANLPGIRWKLRNRSRYEAFNNSYCRGMIDTLAGDVIGTGPRLKIQTGNPNADAFLEREFSAWCKAANLAKKLRTMRKAKCTDGETFGRLITNDRLATPVKLDLHILEADQVATPYIANPGIVNGIAYDAQGNPIAVDGVHYDKNGNPTSYDVLKQHPGDCYITSQLLIPESVPAEYMIHLFRTDRPGQHRGIPELTPALPLFSQLRRFTLATLAAAETAADHAMVVETPLPPEMMEQVDDSSAFDVFELAQRMVTTLPVGTKLNQMKAEHPNTTYGEFKKEILAEAFSCICMPYNIGGHDSSDNNFASGKMDRITYTRMIDIERSEWEIDCIRRIFYAWLDEAFLLPGYLPPFSGLPPAIAWAITCYWDAMEDIDATKAASASQTKLAIGTTTYTLEYAKAGLDPEDEWRKEAQLLGITYEEYVKIRLDSLVKPVPGAANAPNQTTEVPSNAA